MERQYLFTERAHLMCPGMCFGLAALIDAPHDAERIRAAVAALEEAHPFLRAVIGHQAEDNRFFYDVTAVGKTDWTDAHEEIAGLDAPAIFGRCDELTGRDWDLRTEGLLKIVTWKANERLCALFVFHHLLTDGRGALGLVQEFADCYVTGRRPACAQERLIARAEDLPDGAALKGVARWLVARTNQKWRGEGRRLDYAAYHSFADGYVRSQRVAHRCETIDGERLARLSGQCHDRGVTLNDYLAARMMFEEQTNKVIIACDLRQRLKCYRSGALGNYATAFSVKLGRRGGDALTLAKAVHVAVRKVITAIIYLLLQGVGDGCQPLISRYYGERNEADGRRMRSLAYRTALFVSAVCMAAVFLAREKVGVLFGASETANAGVAQVLPYFLSTLLFLAFVRITTSCFYATEKTRLSYILVYAEPVCTLLFLLTLPLGLKLTGVWLAVPLAQTAAFLIALLAKRRVERV